MQYPQFRAAANGLYVWPVVLLTCACTGAIADGSGDDVSDRRDQTGGKVGPGGGGQPGSGPGACSTAARETVGESVLRRLTRVEYDNTVHDLLGVSESLAKAFPPEEEHLGFHNNAAALQASNVLVERYMDAAETLASQAVAKMPADLGCASALSDDACASAFVTEFGERAFRRPLESHEVARYKAVFTAGMAGGKRADGAALVVTAMLQSPHFLYRPEMPVEGRAGVLGSWEIATRLSYTFWGTMPDAALFERARADGLRDPDAIAAEVTRLLDDPRARAQVETFHGEWLGLARIGSMEKDPETHPTFSPALAGDMEHEVRRFVDDVFWEGGDLETLFASDESFVNERLGAIYGVDTANAGFAKVRLGEHRRGLLTRAGLLAMTAEKPDHPSPIYRGKFIRERILCGHIPEPPPGLVVMEPEVTGATTARERFTQHAQDPACATCHAVIDPIGLALENYDALGRWRDHDGGHRIDASGVLAQTDVEEPFDGAAGLAERLAESETAAACVATSWFRFAFGREEREEDACTLADLTDALRAHGRPIDVLRALPRTAAFRFYQPAQ